jgi:DNA-binding MarR family transcriptional regulator
MSALGNAFLTWRRHLKRQMAPYGITLKQSHVLDHLHRHEYLLPSEIANLLFCDRPTASGIVSNLEKQGWVERTPDPQDGRQTRVVLTDQGRLKSVEIQSQVWDHLVPSLHPLGCLNAEETNQLAHLIARVDEHLQHIFQES